jgi:vitamin B12 transporter
MLKSLQMTGGNWLWSLWSSGFYNFKMHDEGATPDVLGRFVDKPTRVSQYAMTIGTRFGQKTSEPWRDWAWRIVGVLHGPQWYNTEETLNAAFFPGQ